MEGGRVMICLHGNPLSSLALNIKIDHRHQTFILGISPHLLSTPDPAATQ